MVYCLLCLGGSMAGLIIATKPSLSMFAVCWTLLSLPAPAVRGVRAAFFAKNVDQKRLVEVGNYASNFGIVGGFAGPLLAAVLSWTAFPFAIASGICCVVFFVCALLIATFMPGERRRDPWRESPTSPPRVGAPSAALPQAPLRKGTSMLYERCELCNNAAGTEEKALCQNCYKDYQSKGISFWWYSLRVMVCCWSFVLLLEISLNAGVMVAFQPVVVTHFRWNSRSIALVNTAGALFGFSVLWWLIRRDPGEFVQANAAAACYLCAVLLFMCPPLAQWRLVAGVMLGVASQLMLYPALEAMFAHKLGKARVTVGRAVVLSLASSVGTAMGTVLAPSVVDRAGSSAALLAAVPALTATIGVSSFGCCRRARRPRDEAKPILKPLLPSAV